MMLREYLNPLWDLCAALWRGDFTLYLAIVFWAVILRLAFGKKLEWLTRWSTRGPVTDMLDTPLMQWTKKDVLTVRTLTEGGIHVFGRTGSGKTSLMKLVARALLKFGNTSILVLCGKKGEAEEWLELCEKTGRSKDVIHFGINQGARFNLIGWESERQGEGAGQVANTVRFMMDMRNVILRQPHGSGGDAEFWRKQDERTITHAVTALQLAGYQITPQAVHDVVMSAPIVPHFRELSEWGNAPCCKVLQMAQQKVATDVEAHDCRLARDFFLSEWPQMASETRGSVSLGTISLLTAMNTGIARELFATVSNTNPRDQIEGRKIVIVNFPADEHGDLSKIAGGGLKWMWQREGLRRRITVDSPVAVIWGDESSLWISDNDANFLSRCRSYRACQVYMCQSLNSYRAVMPGEQSKSAVDAMLSCFGTKLFLALGDSTTANYAAELCGKELTQLGGGSTQYGEADLFNFRGPGHYSRSFSEHRDYIVQPGQFLNGMRTGGPRNKFIVDGLLVRSGVPFANGLPITRVSFDQRK